MRSRHRAWGIPAGLAGLALVVRLPMFFSPRHVLFDDGVYGVTVLAMRAGARGYQPKGANQAVMLRAIRAVANGEAIFGPGIAQRLIGFFSASRPSVQSRIFPELTERESEILAFIAQGHTNQEIAEQLVLSLKTVRNHVSNIFSKLQVADRAQAIIRARDAGLG